MEISDNGLKLIENFEGFISCPYWDVYGRVYTRGFGETGGITANSHCVTRQEAQENLRGLVDNEYGAAVNRLGVPLNQNQFDALCSFVYNLGPGSMEWNIGQSLRARAYNTAANQMLEYDRAGGVVLAGLQARRAAERKLFLTPVKHQQNPLNTLYPSERRVVDLYLSELRHPHLHAKGLKKLKNEMNNMRGNIYDAAVYGELKNHHKVKKGWNINNRESRYDLLKKYST
jgi:lysozyme